VALEHLTSGQNDLAVLIVTADERFLAGLCHSFDQRGWQALGAGDGDAARHVAVHMAPDLALVDLRISSEAEFAIVRTLREVDASLIIIVLTGYSNIAGAVEAIICGAGHYLCGPVDPEQIVAAFQALRDLELDGLRPPVTVPTLASVERAHIQRVLSNCGGNVSQCAKLLGIHRRSLQRKLSRYSVRY
jgi:two-component system, response regulator RegA